ncbi:MAG TPA: N-acetylmuramoyl-L-alanine amidase [Candidatus Atribacteria bacterium]|nr:N-acetylmuramoyl-L-alanine amidase [Candidatus Atribacteria bacterium]HQE24900.1 N-acetylmuramoyl-L-alanine amidase [Candidatus Atribacteria bacterium]
MMTREKSPLFRGIGFVIFLALFSLSFSSSLEAQVQLSWEEERFFSEAEVKTRQGRSYVNVEELFREIGGIVYYSPIMNKINLGFKGTAWVLSLDKGVAVCNGKEVPLEGEVFIERDTPYVSLDFLSQLFGFNFYPSLSPAVPSAEVAPSPAEEKYYSLLLSGVRFHSYSEEMRTRVTFDFQGGVPSYSYRIDRQENRMTIDLWNCDWQQPLSPLVIGDGRIDRIEVVKTAEGLRVNLWLQNPVQVKEEKKLPGDNPRVYFDLVSLVEVKVEDSAKEKPAVSPQAPPKVELPSVSPPSQEAPGLSYNEINTKVVVIDPGHGGGDPGCVYHGYREKDIVLAISQKLKMALENKGYQVFLTRSQDTYPSLNERYRVANDRRPFVFLSIHCNASPNPQATGVEVFVGGVKPRGEGAAEVAGRENQLFLEQRSPEDINRVGNILSSAYYQSSREVSAELGKIMVGKISSVTGQINRGLKEAPLVVLDGMYYPACLVEVGFLSNVEEAKKLASSSFQEKVAQAIAQAVDDFSRNPKFKSFLGE